VRSVKLLGAGKSGHNKQSDIPTVGNIDRARAECHLNWNVYSISAIVNFK